MSEKVPAKLDNLARDMACFLWECSQLRHALFTPVEFIPLVSERLREYLCKHCADVEMLTAKPQWPRIRDLPQQERLHFATWLIGQTCPVIEGAPDSEQDGYYSHDYERWLRFKKTGMEVMD